MRVVATSDFHGTFPEIPECDLLLIAGDVCPVDAPHDVITQRNWMRHVYRPWLEGVPAKEIVWISGNHDFVCESPGFRRVADEFPGHYLQDDLIEIDGVKIFGSPWVPNLVNWAFYRPDVKFIDQSETMPLADIYLLHGPPKGIPHVIFGHIHEGYGLLERGPTTYRNVAHMDRDYRPVNPPQVFELSTA